MLPTARPLASTYDTPKDVEPWERVEQYREAMAYAAENPDSGSTAVANAVDQPRGRVRVWLDGGRPDVVRGLDTATKKQWLDPSAESDIARSLTSVAAHVLGGGSIDARYVPQISLGRRVGSDEVDAAVRQLGVRSMVRHDEDPGRATEIVPRNDGSVLGRCLVSMGLPQGEKRSLESLPAVAVNGTPELRRIFARTYARHRATEYPDKATTRIQEERPSVYLDALAEMYRDVTGERATPDNRGVTLTADATRALDLGTATTF